MKTRGYDLPCPSCGYNLRELPMDSACPECGLKVSVLPDLRSEERARQLDREIEQNLRLAEESAAQAARIERLLGEWEERGKRLDQVMEHLEQMLAWVAKQQGDESAKD